jgi:copper chaperone CopZ
MCCYKSLKHRPDLGYKSAMLRETALSLFVMGSLFACDKQQASDQQGQAENVDVYAKAAKTDDTKVAATAEAKSADCQGDKDGSEASCGNDEAEEAGGCNQWDEEAALVAKRDIPDNAAWETLKVSGMTCGGCERRVIANVGGVDGVLAVEADAELGQVRVATEKGKEGPKVAAIQKIKSLGYKIQ